MKIRKSPVILMLLSSMLLTACGSSSASDSMTESVMMNSTAAPSVSYDSAYDGSYAVKGESGLYDAEEDYMEEDDAPVEEAVDESDAKTNDDSSETAALRKEMLVYSCNMSIDTLDFTASVDSFKSSLEIYGGFVETENYNDGGRGGKWYDESMEKWQSYTATVRVPSSNYEQFCNDTAALGELRSKTASVQNLTNEYYDLNSTLEVYEAKEQRYMKLLAELTEDEYAVAVERELTDIQIEIAKLRSRMNTIKNDVSYSYVYLTINEVKEYQAEPVKTDTFLDRLGNTLADSAEEFLDFLEGALFVFIYLAPYLVIIGIIVFIIVKVRKKRRAKSMAEIAPTTEAAAAPSDNGSEKK